jgi:hypothetical protein
MCIIKSPAFIGGREKNITDPKLVIAFQINVKDFLPSFIKVN